jgi:hypothetical protein
MDNSTTVTPAPQLDTPVRVHTLAAIDQLAIVLGLSLTYTPDEQKHYLREALRELWRALESLPQVA